MNHLFSIWKLRVAGIVFPMFLWACGTYTPGPPPALVSLSVTPVVTSIALGTATQFTATGTFSDGSFQIVNSAVTWSSSNTTIATVSNSLNSQGLVTSTQVSGTTTITATSGNLKGSASLTTSPVVSIAVTPPLPPSLATGTTQQFDASGTLANSSVQNLTSWAVWSSSNTGIATISNASGSLGLATVVSAPGFSTIEAAFGGINGTTTLTSSPLTSIAITPASESLPVGTTQKFSAAGTLADSTVQNLTNWVAWNSSDTAISTIGNGPKISGLASAVSVGSANITANFDGITSNASVLTVTSAVLVSLSVTPVNPSIALGKTQQFTATGTYTDHSTKDLTALASWSSSNILIGTVSNTLGSNGLFSSLTQGTTEITATVSGIKSNTAVIKVTPAVLVTITVTPGSATILVGFSQQFKATGTYSDGSTEDLTSSVVWASSNTNIATISNLSGSQGLALSNPSTTGSTSISASYLGIASNLSSLTVQI